MIRALSKLDFKIYNISNAQDTVTLQKLLQTKTEELNVGPAGTTFRFLTAFLSLQPGTQILTGSKRMKERPIGILVDALRQLGATIDYLEKEGYPPLKIGEKNKNFNYNKTLKIPANISSQFISALLLIAPALPHGLELHLEGKIVSRSYINMTLEVLWHFGIKSIFENNIIKIENQKFVARDFTVESDWSSASYFYAMAAFSDEVELYLNGLNPNSLQGDAATAKLAKHFGVETLVEKSGILLRKNKSKKTLFVHSFLECPDIAQTFAVIAAGLGKGALLSNLETLRIKETDRIQALKNELDKIEVESKIQEPGSLMIAPSKTKNSNTIFDTYKDHRMAMAFAPLAIPLGKIGIEDPLVVKKSYPDYWRDLLALGFEIEESA